MISVTWRLSEGDNVFFIYLFMFFLTADVKTDARAKMSVAAKMSLFKVSLCLSRH